MTLPPRLLRSFILRPLRQDKLRTALTVLAVALGVGVVIAVDLAGAAAGGSFASSLETLLGKTDLVVTANAGIDERWAARLARLPRDLRVSPVLETLADFGAVRNVPVYGIDFIAQSPTGSSAGVRPPAGVPIALSRALARRLSAQAGAVVEAQLSDRAGSFHVAGLIDAGDAEFALLDIADAQRALGSYGRLDRIEITAGPGEDFAAAEREIRALLPAAYSLERPGVRREENQRMLRAFRWNLRVLSFISLLVGAFLIYNTISVSVVRRRAELGVLRALGADRSGILGLFLGEALLIGLAGSALGVLIGRLLAAGVVGMIADTVNSLYVSSRPGEVTLTPWSAFGGIAAGVIVALLSAFAPAREAMRVAPASAMGRGAHEHAARLRWRLDLALAAVCAAAAFAASLPGPVDGKPVWGYLSALAAVASAALAAPSLVLAVEAGTRRPVRRALGAEGLLAGRGLAASLSRTSVIVAALATAIAMMASVGIMVGSFRETVLVWLDSQLRADLYVRASGRATVGQFPALSPAVPPLVQAVDGVEAVDIFHAFEFRYNGRRATLGAGDLAIVLRYGRLRFLEGGSREAILRSLPNADRIIVSEPFANKHGVHAGDRIRLPLGDREVPVTVAGVYYDYSSELGVVIIDRSTLLKYLPSQPATNLAVYVRPGVDPEQVRRRIQQAAATYRLVIADNRSLRRGAVVIFDRTFAITYALEAVAILVAMLGAANSLLALVLDRRREIGLLRFLGASPRQIRRMVLVEAGFLGLLANLLGLALGAVLSLLLIYVINKQSFGWTIQFHPPMAMLAGALSLIWITTVAAAWYPARVASRLDPIDVLHLE